MTVKLMWENYLIERSQKSNDTERMRELDPLHTLVIKVVSNELDGSPLNFTTEVLNPRHQIDYINSNWLIQNIFD